MARKKARSAASHKRLIKLLKKHKRIKIVLAFRASPDKVVRERILTSKGSSIVRYFQPEYARNERDDICYNHRTSKPIIVRYKPSRYTRSCFQDYLRKNYSDYGPYQRLAHMRNKAEAIVLAMKSHDYRDYIVKSVYVGKGFKKKVA